MIQPGTVLKVADNSAIKEVRCIRILGKKKNGKQGDRIVASVFSLSKSKNSAATRLKNAPKKFTSDGSQWKKGDLVRALIVRTTKENTRLKNSGISIKFPQENSVVILETNLETPTASRINGPVAPSVRFKGFSKIVSLGGSTL